MFAKLLKHEFRAVRGIFTILSIAALVAGLIGGLLIHVIFRGIKLDDTYIVDENGPETVASILLTGIIFALFAYLVCTMILLIYRFYKSKFTDEGYLTFTLPATTHQILLSSIANIVIWSIIVTLVFTIACSLLIISYMIELDRLSPIDWSDFTLLPDRTAKAWCINIFQGVAAAVYSLILPLLCITIGALVAKKHKLLAAFGIYYGISMALSILEGYIEAVHYLDYLTADHLINGELASPASLIPSIVQLILGVGGYFIMHHLIQKKLNLP